MTGNTEVVVAVAAALVRSHREGALLVVGSRLLVLDKPFCESFSSSQWTLPNHMISKIIDANHDNKFTNYYNNSCLSSLPELSFKIPVILY